MTTEKQWYTIKTTPNQEKKVKGYIERFTKINKLEEFIGEILLPTQREVLIRHGKKISKETKLYPGYLFINIALFNPDGQIYPEVTSFMRSVPGFLGFVGTDKPMRLSPTELETIRTHIKNTENKEVPKLTYELGEMVRVLDGAFQNMTGKIEELDAARGRLKISVAIFGRFTPVELEFWQVQKEVNSK